ncbi:MAG: phospho-sugar mutase [Lachnospiraceae bacterium]|nr:phospho-sugar mutase [Lachnospiraceae bacterium]
MNARERFEQWLNDPVFDEATKAELREIENDENAIRERFEGDLEFGTGGMRGLIGAGTRRMNVYTVRKATQGLANYIIKKGAQKRGVALSFDSRRCSDEFAREAALTLCANGIPIYIFPILHPTPMLSFAVRDLGCTAGINITASHNPPDYNGYKAYWDDGAQVTIPDDELIIEEVNAIQSFADVKTMSLEDAQAAGLYHIIGPEVDEHYYAELKKLIRHPEAIAQEKDNITLVYTPLHGTGLIPAKRILDDLGFSRVFVVEEQAQPDGNFPTVGYPNPEDPKAFVLALELARKVNADIVIANDPDADRLGVFLKNGDDYMRLTGNMTGCLLADYEIGGIKETRGLNEHGVFISTIVTSNMAGAIARKYGVRFYETLTGFKHICGKLRDLEQTEPEVDYLYGFEESFGSSFGPYCRDKDGIAAVMALCEAVCYYKTKGMSLWDGLQALYKQVGYYKDINISKNFPGLDGKDKMAAIMNSLRNDPPKTLGGLPVVAMRDYQKKTTKNFVTGEEGVTTLPVSNVIYFELTDDAWVCLRPSGTEPKIKLYCGVKGETEAEAAAKEKVMVEELNALMDSF